MSEPENTAEDLKTISLRLDRDTYRALSHYAFDHAKTRTAVIREAIAAHLAIIPAATKGDDENAQSEGKGKTRTARKGK
jgi:predicted transcriptional regulator